MSTLPNHPLNNKVITEPLREIKIQTGYCCNNPFKRFYEEGHNPQCEFVEFKCPNTGKITRRTPESKAIRLANLSDEELNDYLSPEHLKQMRQEEEERKKYEGRDLAKDICEAREKEEKNKEDRLAKSEASLKALEEREKILIEYSRQQEKEFADYKTKTDEQLNKLTSLIQQLMTK
jgi:hypothetical protein